MEAGAAVRVMGLQGFHEERGPQAKECWPLEAEKGEETDFPLCSEGTPNCLKL